MIPRRTLLAAVAAIATGACALPFRTRGPGREWRAMWVWSSRELLGSPERQAALFDFSLAHRIGTLRMQVTSAPLTPQWQALLRAAHARGLRVEALDGDPSWAHRGQHAAALAVAGAVIAYNHAAPRDARFDGIHFDVEPYLLPQWNARALREPLLADMLTLHDAVQQRARAAGLRYGIDVPFWWHEPDARTGEPIGVVTYAGARRSASLHAALRLDSVTLMDYRNDAEGPDGLAAHASLLLRDASERRDARVLIGVETTPVIGPGNPTGVELPKVTFASRPEAMEPELAIARRVFRQFPAYAGIAVHHYDAYRALIAASETRATRTN